VALQNTSCQSVIVYLFDGIAVMLVTATEAEWLPFQSYQRCHFEPRLCGAISSIQKCSRSPPKRTFCRLQQDGGSERVGYLRTSLETDSWLRSGVDNVVDLAAVPRNCCFVAQMLFGCIDFCIRLRPLYRIHISFFL
jgi:hypothetical protein